MPADAVPPEIVSVFPACLYPLWAVVGDRGPSFQGGSIIVATLGALVFLWIWKALTARRAV